LYEGCRKTETLETEIGSMNTASPLPSSSMRSNLSSPSLENFSLPDIINVVSLFRNEFKPPESLWLERKTYSLEDGEGDYDRFISEKDEIGNFYVAIDGLVLEEKGIRRDDIDDVDLGIIEIDEDGWEEDEWDEEKMGGKRKKDRDVNNIRLSAGIHPPVIESLSHDAPVESHSLRPNNQIFRPCTPPISTPPIKGEEDGGTHKRRDSAELFEKIVQVGRKEQEEFKRNSQKSTRESNKFRKIEGFEFEGESLSINSASKIRTPKNGKDLRNGCEKIASISCEIDDEKKKNKNKKTPLTPVSKPDETILRKIFENMAKMKGKNRGKIEDKGKKNGESGKREDGRKANDGGRNDLFVKIMRNIKKMNTLHQEGNI
jgi:hypothetical protein